MVAEKVQGKSEREAKIDETRIAWQIDFERKSVQPVEQKFSKKAGLTGAISRSKDCMNAMLKI
ncbi:MAG: hypothetical protein HC846_01295 [Blastocatellia bacterium]|nr:hypothetical protein [Blastocatellia bacterium]